MDLILNKFFPKTVDNPFTELTYGFQIQQSWWDKICYHRYNVCKVLLKNFVYLGIYIRE